MIPVAAVLAAGLGAPALAQNADAPAPSIAIPAPATNSADAVGPAQLRDFSLKGTVTRRAETPAAVPATPRPAQTQAATAAREPATSTATPAAAAPQRAAPAAVATAERPASPREAGPTASAASALNFPPPTPAQTGSPNIVEPLPASVAAAAPIASTPDAPGGMFSHWPWLLALLAAAGAALWYFRRQRSGYAFAGAGADAGFEFSPPAPPARPVPERPQPAPPRAAPTPPVQRSPLPEQPLVGGVVSTRLRVATEAETAPAPPVTGGLVSSRLRPWIELEFVPLSAVIDGDQAVIEFQLSLFNSGSAPARDVLVEAKLFNAGEGQDEAIASFFGNRNTEGEAVPLVAPLQRMDFRTTTSVPRNAMRIFEAGGRQVFVPLIGFNAVYRYGGGQGQTSTSYIIGRDGAGEKMAPFFVGDGAKRYTGLGAREHSVRVRK